MLSIDHDLHHNLRHTGTKILLSRQIGYNLATLPHRIRFSLPRAYPLHILLLLVGTHPYELFIKYFGCRLLVADESVLLVMVLDLDL